MGSYRYKARVRVCVSVHQFQYLSFLSFVFRRLPNGPKSPWPPPPRAFPCSLCATRQQAAEARTWALQHKVMPGSVRISWAMAVAAPTATRLSSYPTLSLFCLFCLLTGLRLAGVSFFLFLFSVLEFASYPTQRGQAGRSSEHVIRMKNLPRRHLFLKLTQWSRRWAKSQSVFSLYVCSCRSSPTRAGLAFDRNKFASFYLTSPYFSFVFFSLMKLASKRTRSKERRLRQRCSDHHHHNYDDCRLCRDTLCRQQQWHRYSDGDLRLNKMAVGGV